MIWMPGRAIGEFLNAPVQQSGIHQLQVVVVDPTKYRGISGTTGEHRKYSDLNEINEAGCKQRMIHGKGTVGPKRHLGIPLQSSDHIQRVIAFQGRTWPI